MRLPMHPVPFTNRLLLRIPGRRRLNFCKPIWIDFLNCLSLQNIFILVLQEKKLRDILKELLTIESNFEMVKLFIDFEPSITKSKYITKFLNANSNIKL